MFLTVAKFLWTHLQHDWTNGVEEDLIAFILQEVDKLAPGSITQDVVHKLLGEYALKRLQAPTTPAAAPAS